MECTDKFTSDDTQLSHKPINK